ncbi:AAEL004786-PA [Aedes aegypti]|uniref:AAEL004786-PA n=1 Tax=Aedes aegypti TaxID=7159 RepID=Q17BX7_AEDAE|nr:AAEL004786-PA [Aedes aegypti]
MLLVYYQSAFQCSVHSAEESLSVTPGQLNKMNLTKGKRYHKAARENNLQVLQEANRWEVNTVDENGLIPLHWAAHEGHREAVRILLKRKSKINKMDNFGNSALHLAAARGHLECVELLLSKGANIYGLDGGQRTACDLARIGAWDEVVDFLVLRVTMLEETRPKLVLKLKVMAKQHFLKIKDKPVNGAIKVDPQINLLEENESTAVSHVSPDEFISTTNTPEDVPTEEDLYQQNFNLLGLMQHKTSGTTSSTSKSAARFHLVFSELVKEQSINQTIVNSIESRPQRKSIKPVHSTLDDKDSDEETDTPTVSTQSALRSFLKIYDLQRFHQQLLDKGIDLDGLILMTEHDLKALGLPLGPHRKLCVALEEYKIARKWYQA